MLTIFAWMVFIPAVFWNIAFLCVVFYALMETKTTVEWTSKRNLRDAALSLAVLFIPGIYLFGFI